MEINTDSNEILDIIKDIIVSLSKDTLQYSAIYPWINFLEKKGLKKEKILKNLIKSIKKTNDKKAIKLSKIIEEKYLLDNKRSLGQYFTKTNCFMFSSFKEWFNSIKDNKNCTLIEPFAGEGNIPKMMLEAGYKNKWKMFDIYPTSQKIKKNDSIANCPKGVIITNPPYLAKNSAKRRSLDFPETKHDDIYKLALENMLNKNDYIAAIIPESFITSKLFLNRLNRAISLTIKMFDDTECPVCLACFSPENDNNRQKIYRNEEFIGELNTLKEKIPNPYKKNKTKWKFNDPNGQIGLIAIDNQKESSIQFVKGETIDSKSIKISSRAKTRIKTSSQFSPILIIQEANKILYEFRKNTKDVFLTSFKGLRKDNYYRRRLDFNLAKLILDLAEEKLENANKL